MLKNIVGSIGVLLCAFTFHRLVIFGSGGDFWPESIRAIAGKINDGLKFAAFVVVCRFGKEE